MAVVRDLSGNGVSPDVGGRPSISDDSSTGQFFAVVVGTPWDVYCRALFVGVGGNVTAVNEFGTAVVFKNVANGTRLDIRTKNVSAATATDIVRLM